MYNSTKSIAIHTPKNISDYITMARNYENVRIFSGGTYLTRRMDSIIDSGVRDFIDIRNLKELTRITRNEEYIEIGSLVTLSHLLLTGKNILPKMLVDCLNSISTEVVRNKATIGGCICTKDCRLSLCSVLSALQTIVEVRRPSNKKNSIEWIPITSLYNGLGKLNLKDNELVTRIRLSFVQGNFQYYKCIGDIIRDRNNCLQFAFQGNLIQNKLLQSSFCFNYPNYGTIVLPDMQNVLNNSIFPYQPSTIAKQSTMLIEMLEQKNRALGDLSLELSKRIFEKCLMELNLFSINNDI